MGKTDLTVELWKKIDGNYTVTQEGNWIQVDLENGLRLRILQPSRKYPPVNKPEGPVTFEEFRYDDQVVVEEKKVRREQGGSVGPWEPASPGVPNVVATSAIVNGEPHEGNPQPGPGFYVKRVSCFPGIELQNDWEPGAPL